MAIKVEEAYSHNGVVLVRTVDGGFNAYVQADMIKQALRAMNVDPHAIDRYVTEANLAVAAKIRDETKVKS